MPSGMGISNVLIYTWETHILLTTPFSNMGSHVKLNALHINPALSHEGVFLCRKN